MAQVSATNGASASALSRQEVQAALSQFDAKINQMGGFPAKDIINALTKLAERAELAQDIVSFLETKIHRVTQRDCRLCVCVYGVARSLAVCPCASLRMSVRVCA